MYPIDKYKYFVAGNKVIAVSTYAGRSVRGVAICDSNDTFSLEKGKELAAARCAVKVAEKRMKRAQKKIWEADLACVKAEKHFDAMADYLNDATCEVEAANSRLAEILDTL